ncbi:hypothetical protein DAEQUDRAFT_362933 [Daedalea quercina L-15889]|uniref:Uncharacterized protein n=1 Tax=Daedalea quercina L-15889 TaxID=1314783 RepID=A0A165TU07_9APHY|nr:hypothetical protein DAEQUDRAFT_362933 [Daedalea quercina L-15889]
MQKTRTISQGSKRHSKCYKAIRRRRRYRRTTAAYKYSSEMAQKCTAKAKWRVSTEGSNDRPEGQAETQGKGYLHERTGALLCAGFYIVIKMDACVGDANARQSVTVQMVCDAKST